MTGEDSSGVGHVGPGRCFLRNLGGPGGLDSGLGMNPQSQEDLGVSLMLRYQAGDEAAFDEIVGLYADRVFALLTRFLGHVADREDMVQEVFLRVLRSRERYDPKARFSTWLYRITFNLAANKRERSRDVYMARDQGHASDVYGDDHASEVSDPKAQDATTELERQDVVLAVRQAIASLPENQRMALILAKYQDMPYHEIAEVLSSSEKAVKSLIHRARETLRERLAPFLEQVTP